MKEWIFAAMAPPGKGAREALLLARSIRRFAGRMAGSPVWVFVPRTGEALEAAAAAAFGAADVRLVPFSLSDEALNFPFADKVFAAAEAERLASGAASELIWMDRGSLVLQEPDALELPANKVLGYRPVDHTLIGSPAADAVDDFWALVYQSCQVLPEHLFTMLTSVDAIEIRPYFNAGMLVVRPERQLLQQWADNFERLFLTPRFMAFYEREALSRIFVHQAILAGTILAACAPEELQLLPHLVNYPLHMHNAYPGDRRPQRMNDLVSCRYENLLQDSAWEAVIAVDEPLKSWLKEQRENSWASA